MFYDLYDTGQKNIQTKQNISVPVRFSAWG